MRTFAAAAVLFCLAVPLAAQIDDSDFSSPHLSAESAARLGLEGRLDPNARTRVFALRRAPLAKTRGGARAVTGALLLADRAGEPRPARLARARLEGPGAPPGWMEADASGRFIIPLDEGLSGSYRLRLSLDNRYWVFHNPGEGSSYEWETTAFLLASGEGLDLGDLQPAQGSENAKLGVLHLTYLEALALLEREGDTRWWTKALTVNWPGQADFFSPWSWSLDLTNALAWDVVLHELGHAVMHGSMKADSAGGPHKIDECYRPALAWSEGWATFFAAAVRLKPDDADAKFEFLVPRRAPIRLENVPEDVCRGESNEWRVAAGLWDLLDSHEDGGDRISLSFVRLWKSLRGQSMGSLRSSWALIAKGLNPLERRGAEDALISNSVLPPRPPLTAALPPIPAEWAGPR